MDNKNSVLVVILCCACVLGGFLVGLNSPLRKELIKNLFLALCLRQNVIKPIRPLSF